MARLASLSLTSEKEDHHFLLTLTLIVFLIVKGILTFLFTTIFLIRGLIFVIVINFSPPSQRFLKTSVNHLLDFIIQKKKRRNRRPQAVTTLLLFLSVLYNKIKLLSIFTILHHLHINSPCTSHDHSRVYRSINIVCIKTGFLLLRIKIFVIEQSCLLLAVNNSID